MVPATPAELDDQVAALYAHLTEIEQVGGVLLDELVALADRTETRVQQIGTLAAQDVATDVHVLVLGNEVAAVRAELARTMIGLSQQMSSWDNALSGLDEVMSTELRGARSDL